MITLAIAGKPNCGKSTFFTAATMAHAEIANYPFTTIDANHGVAYVRTECPCRELGVTCEVCDNGVRYIPVSLIDVAGLVPEAHKGRGLGNQFLDHLRQADAILHLIDASGGTDAEGNPVGIGEHDPLEDVGFIEREMTMWVYGIIEKHWQKIQRSSQQRTYSIAQAVADVFAGLGVTAEQVRDVEHELAIDLRRIGEEELVAFCERLVQISKPMLVVGNKADQAPGPLLDRLEGAEVIFASAAGELALRKAAEGSFITYHAGDADFSVNETAPLTDAQKAGLEAIRAFMKRWGGTGVQKAIDAAVYGMLDRIVVYPVEDEQKFCDGQGRVLPDAFLMKRGSTPHDLAYQVHTDIGEGFLYAVDARKKMRIKEDHVLEHGDIIKIVSTRR
ncbi:MAG: redox-regulated ATPase YchF [Methanomicrobiaceae archaeon]|nr:redox-regulated ATPase YchF [Methanomicrobiaceae archaeon]